MNSKRYLINWKGDEMKKTISKDDKPRRVSIYLYPWMLKKVEEICQKHNKRKRHFFMEAIVHYIQLHEKYWKGN